MVKLDALVISGDSKVGSALMTELRGRGLLVMATTRRSPATGDLIPFDLKCPSYLPQAKVTYFCSGITGFKACLEEPEVAAQVNLLGHYQTAELQAGHLVLLSSCAAETHPDTVYGTLKKATEVFFGCFGDRSAMYRFGPVAFPGRNVYPNKEYNPISMPALIKILADATDAWQPGLHRVLNEDKL